MATLIGDYAAEHSRFHHSMIPSSYQHQPQSQQHQQSHEPRYRSESHSRDPAARHSSSSSPTSRRARPSRTPVLSSTTRSPISKESQQRREREIALATADSLTTASRFPTPPDSSSPGSSASTSSTALPQSQSRSQHEQSESYMAVEDTLPSHSSSSASSTHTIIPPSSSTQRLPHSIPSPPTDQDPWAPAHGAAAASASQTSPTQKVIHVTDLAHIERLAKTDALGGSGPGVLDDPPLQEMKFEISAMPIGDIIEMVAALLTKITTTNDLQHDALTRNVTHQRQAQAQNEGSDAQSSPFSTSVLAFHGKNVPAITILSYLTRIHKYCPTTYEVFLSLLVYFDRMTERVNERVMKDEEAKREKAKARAATPAAQDTAMAEVEVMEGGDDDLADSDDEGSDNKAAVADAPAEPAMDAAASGATYFVVDSFNIHRLIIAGVTCASKFFSDVFYTNSRYAKVGGLPLPELNHLELQFLLLNDFRLAVPVEDLEGYATMLVEFYAREVVAQRSRPAASG